MSFSVGILIIGSLYWDTSGGRNEWRENRLQMSRDFVVKAPIRYGRRSKTGTFTMVFGSVPTLGQARVVPCKKSVVTVEDLIDEAEWLWAAERREVPGDEQNLDHKLSSDWGSVALLTNPKVNMSQSWKDCWTKSVLTKSDETARAWRLVDDLGLLQLPWPKLARGDHSTPLDLLLATTNSPTLTNNLYPTAHEVADAWNQETGGSAEYFRKNRSSGIYTFEDDAISSCLRPDLRLQFERRW
jgi:hypothetical protein